MSGNNKRIELRPGRGKGLGRVDRAVAFHDAAIKGEPVVTAAGTFDKTFLLVSISVFVALLVVGFVYEWGRGVLRWT